MTSIQRGASARARFETSSRLWLCQRKGPTYYLKSNSVRFFATEYSYAAFQAFLHQRILKRYAPTDRKSSLYDIKTVQYKEWFSRFADMRSKLADSKQLGFFMNTIH